MTTTPSLPITVSGLGDSDSRRLPLLQLDRRTYERALDCVQCGLCLPACPTYLTTGLEADSPRGRIRLMKGLADGRVDPDQPVVRHLDLCLDCRGCETACPSGVVYHELIEETRARLHDAARQHDHAPPPQPWADRWVHWLIFKTMPYPDRLRKALAPVKILRKLGLWRWVSRGPLARILPKPFSRMARMLPADEPFSTPALQDHYPAQAPDGRRKATVALFTGCVGSVLFPHLNQQAIDLLRHAGCDVIVPRTQGCCGAMHHHTGQADQARAFARINLDTFLTGSEDRPAPDYIVNHIAGCGAMLKEYPHLFRDDPVNSDRAARFASRVRDISELLTDLQPPRPAHPLPAALRTVTYHDACHLAHAQKITQQPREMLRWIDGLSVTALPESDLCCGAAGSYSLTQPEMADQLGERKARRIQETGARVCVTGNVGCAMQIQAQADRLGIDLAVVHPITLLHQAYFGENPASGP